MEPTIEPKTDAERPRQVSRGVQIFAVALAIGLLTAIVHLAQRLSGAPMLFASLIVIAVFSIGFFLVRKIAMRRNWARIVCLVLVLFGLPFAIPANLQEIRRNALSGAISLIVTLLQLIGTYLLFTRQSNLWFKTRR